MSRLPRIAKERLKYALLQFDRNPWAIIRDAKYVLIRGRQILDGYADRRLVAVVHGI
jgi:hypothetical protein